MARTVTWRDIPYVRGERRAGDPPRLVASADKIRRELGWRPDYQDLRKIIASAWAWMMEHPDGYGVSQADSEMSPDERNE